MQQSSIAGSIRIDSIESLAREKIAQTIADIVGDSVHLNPSNSSHQDWLAENIMAWAIAIQLGNQIIVSRRFSVEYSSTLESYANVYKFVFPYSIPLDATSQCFDWIKVVVNEVQLQATGELSTEVIEKITIEYQNLCKNLKSFVAPSINRFYLACAAFELDFPIRPMQFDVYVLGEGVRSRLFSSSITDETPAIGVRISKEKTYASELLRAAGFPVPPQALVNNAEDAVAKADKFGYPVVVKPADEDEGRGVAADLPDAQHVIQAYEYARKHSNKILVEKHIPGCTHRLTVVNQKIVKVSKRIAGGVIGNGRSNVKELVEIESGNTRFPTVESRHGPALVSLDEEARSLLSQYELGESYIPAAGEYVRLRRRDNYSSGGVNEPVEIDVIHEDNINLALRVAKLFRLDFVGVDLIIDDVSKSWIATNGAICEVNAQPTLGISNTPFIYHEFLKEMFPEGANIPVHLGIVSESTEFELSKAFLLQQELEVNWLSCSRGLFHNQVKVSKEFANGYAAAKSLLLNNDVAAAFCLTTAAEILEFGTASAKIDSLVVVNEQNFSEEEKQKLKDAIGLIRSQTEREKFVTVE